MLTVSSRLALRSFELIVEPFQKNIAFMMGLPSLQSRYKHRPIKFMLSLAGCQPAKMLSLSVTQFLSRLADIHLAIHLVGDLVD